MVSRYESALTEQGTLAQLEGFTKTTPYWIKVMSGEIHVTQCILREGPAFPISALSARDCVSETPCNLTQRGPSFGKCSLPLSK